MVLKVSSPLEGRVGTRHATEGIETYLRRAYDLFGGGKAAKDVVLLLELFFLYKVGRDGNKPKSGHQAVIAISDFLEFTKTPPWMWSSSQLYEYLTSLSVRNLSRATIRGRHHYIKHFCGAVLADRDIANKIQMKYPDASFQQITNESSRALVKGFAKRKKTLSNPSPKEVQQVLDYLDSEFVEAVETGATGAGQYVLLRDRAIIATFYAYGVRLSELVKADVTDFDYDPECPDYGELGIWHIIGKGDKDRHLPVFEPWIYSVLRAYLDHVRPHWTHDPRTPEKDRNALFFGNFRRRISTTTVERIVKERFSEAGVQKNISPHRLRNGCLTRITDNVGLSQAAKVAGHSHAAVTEGYYSRQASAAGDPLRNHVETIYRQQFTAGDSEDED